MGFYSKREKSTDLSVVHWRSIDSWDDLYSYVHMSKKNSMFYSNFSEDLVTLECNHSNVTNFFFNWLVGLLTKPSANFQ